MVIAKDDLESRLASLEQEVLTLRQQVAAEKREDAVSLICFSGDWDRLFAAFTIANGALAMGQEVDLFFTFWGAASLCSGEGEADADADADAPARSLSQRVFRSLLPGGLSRTRLSQFNFGGLGKSLMGRLARKHGVADLQELAADAQELGARFHYCDTTLELMGLGAGEIFGGDRAERCGVTTFLARALKSKMVLFV